ncbi:hypothetical protein MNBD_GAMMA02-912 [hydrothermal vent metagenome]|uniref:Uncharacterized protein n=1 Tax=hydrothermal vent metagenome TaxID=652676 RepID=A0A3B0WWC4_9ZZZZ
MNKDYDPSINNYLNQQPQMRPPKDGFDAIMDQVHQQKRQRSFRIPAVAAAVLAAIMLWQLPNFKNSTDDPNNNQFNTNQSRQLNLLTEKIAMIEYVVRNEVINHSAPGSPILEKMISMENWLDQLDLNIAQTDETSQKLELLHAKLEILGDLVALHKKYKPQEPQQVI